MNVFSRIVLATLFLLSPLALAADMSADAKKLAALDDEWSKTAATHDGSKVAAYYADDAVVYPPNAPVANGKAAATKLWSDFLKDPSTKLSWTTTHAEVQGNFGYTSGTYEASFNGPDGRPTHEAGKYLCVWKKQADGSWKAIHDMWNADK